MADFYDKKMNTYFTRMDNDNDGAITKKDFQQMSERFKVEAKLSDERVEKLRKSLEAVFDKYFSHIEGGDKESISKDQFKAAMKKVQDCKDSQELLKGPLTLFFSAVDANEDGMISSDEYTVFFKCIGIDTSLAADSFKAIDANNDGLLSVEEFVNAGMEFYLNNNENCPTKLFWGPLV